MAKRKPTHKMSKREKFEEARRASRRKYSILALVLVVVVAGLIVALIMSTRTPAVGGAVVQEGGADYNSNAPVMMSLLDTLTVNPDTVELSVAEITSKKIGGVVYSRTTPMPAGYNDIPGNGLPVLAYVASSGRLVVASSLCEPCRSYNFHIEGDHLVCNACFTRWDLNTLKGIEGGCLTYPPSELQTTVLGDKVIIEKDLLENWSPRI